jgi:hypothetical protein
VRFTVVYLPAGQVYIDLWVKDENEPLIVAFHAQIPQPVNRCSNLVVTLRDPTGCMRSELTPGQPYECTNQSGIWRLGTAPVLWMLGNPQGAQGLFSCLHPSLARDARCVCGHGTDAVAAGRRRTPRLAYYAA